MQIINILGELLLERIGHHLGELRAGFHRQFRFGQQHIGAGHEHAYAPPGGG